MLLTGSGEGGVLIDSDVVFHRTGFPYIPAKRIKGALKESAEEVLEIAGVDEFAKKNILQALFGKPGASTFEGKLMFKNLYLEHWEDIMAFLKKHPGYSAFQPENIKAQCTIEIQQTAIDVAGIAQKYSLRNYRVIVPGLSFQCRLGVNDVLEDPEKDCLNKAVLNLRYLGTRRNRGFGKVKCCLSELIIPEIKISSAESISAGSTNNVGQQTDRLIVKISTKSPVVIAQQLGEQNTVFTQKYISGNQLRGLLVQKWAQINSLLTNLSAGNNWHKNDEFYSLFLSGLVQYGPLYFNGGMPIPLHIHQFKMTQEAGPVSVFARPEGITKPIGNIGRIDVENRIETNSFEPKTSFNFHNSRPNRTAGRNTSVDSDGGIFYYEAIDEGQIFTGEIRGVEEKLLKILNLFGSRFTARMGRSKAAQYGDVEVELSMPAEHPNNAEITIPSGKYVLVLESPLVLLNNYGFPVPNGTTLLNALPEGMGDVATIEYAATSTTTIEQFNSVWLAKSGKMPAYKEGSSFLIELKKEVKLDRPLTYIGLWNEQGFGKVKLEAFNVNTAYTIGISNVESDMPEANHSSDLKNAIPSKLTWLHKINDSFMADQAVLQAKSLAIKDAKNNSKHILNHQISRLERLFERSNYPEAISEWIANAKDKPAWEALKKVGIVDGKSGSDINRPKLDGFLLQRVYWITYFQTMRKLNKYGKGKSR